MTIVRMGEQHVAAIAAIESACFADPWSETALTEELDNPHAVFYAAVEGDVVLGYGGMHHIGDEGYITNVAVAPDARRCGVARAILAAFEEHAVTHALARITLEVRVGNVAAIALYEGAGYTRDAVRPRFYRHPVEDAAIYSLWRTGQ